MLSVAYYRAYNTYTKCYISIMCVLLCVLYYIGGAGGGGDLSYYSSIMRYYHNIICEVYGVQV